MSKAGGARKDARNPQPTPPAPAKQPAAPFKPQRILFIVMAIIFAAWVAALLFLYATTVYPRRHPPRATTSPAARASGTSLAGGV